MSFKDGAMASNSNEDLTEVGHSCQQNNNQAANFGRTDRLRPLKARVITECEKV